MQDVPWMQGVIWLQWRLQLPILPANSLEKRKNKPNQPLCPILIFLYDADFYSVQNSIMADFKLLFQCHQMWVGRKCSQLALRKQEERSQHIISLDLGEWEHLGNVPQHPPHWLLFMSRNTSKTLKIFIYIGYTIIRNCKFQFSEIKSPRVRKSFIFHDIPAAYSYLAVSGSEPTTTSAGNLFSIIFCLLLNLLDQTILCSLFPIHL